MGEIFYQLGFSYTVMELIATGRVEASNSADMFKHHQRIYYEQCGALADWLRDHRAVLTGSPL